MSNSNNTEVPVDDLPFQEDFSQAVIVLFAPFLIVPLTIILFRLVIFSIKIYKARLAGKENELLADPLAELGFKPKKKQLNFKIASKRKKSKLEPMEIIDSPVQDQAPNNLSWLNDEAKDWCKKIWHNNLSPEAVNRFLTQSRLGRIWMVFQVVFTVLAIVNYVLLTYLAQSDDRSDRKLVKTLDLAYAGIFMIDYLLALYISEDALIHYFKFSSMIDLVSIVTPFIVISNVPGQYVWFLGLIRIFKATRIIRTYKILSFSQSEESRELTTFGLNFFNFIFFSASIINATETIFSSWQAPPTLLNWHDSLYYIIVTFSTIGFGDLTPNSMASRIVVMILIILVIVYIPVMTSRISELYNSMSQYQRAIYDHSEKHAHVVLSGVISFNAIVDFCREFYASDPNGHIVIMTMNEPSMETKRLLTHPSFRSRMFYIQGDVTSPRDLKRARSTFATGLFLLNENSENPSVDQKIIMTSLMVKNYDMGIPIFIQVQDFRSMELSKSCGADRVLCIQELKTSLMARTCLVPGLITLLTNLVNTYPESTIENDSSDFWKKDYQNGVDNQIHSFRIPPGLIGVPFSVAVKILYRDFGGTLFAVMQANSGFYNNNVRLNPDPMYMLQESDIGLIITDSNDIIVSYIAFNYNIPFDWETIDFNNEMNNNILKSSSEFSEIKEILKSELDNDIENKKSHLIICGDISLDYLELFVNIIWTHKQSKTKTLLDVNVDENISIVCIMEKIPSNTEQYEKLCNMPLISFIIGNKSDPDILTKAGIKTCKKIVMFTDQSEANESQPDAKSVLMLNMIQRLWPHVSFLVEITDGSSIKYFSRKDYEWDTGNLRMQSILNNYEMLVSDRIAKYAKTRLDSGDKSSTFSQTVRFFLGEPSKDQENKGQNPQYKKLLDSGDDSSPEESKAHGAEGTLSEQYFQNLLDQAESNESGISQYPVYHFDKHFAAGDISISSSMHSLLCQSYFRPYIVDVIKGLSSNLIQIRIPEALDNCEYGEFFNWGIDNGYVIIGLYRNGAKGNNSGMQPFVFTNCQNNYKVRSGDLAFALDKSNKNNNL